MLPPPGPQIHKKNCMLASKIIRKTIRNNKHNDPNGARFARPIGFVGFLYFGKLLVNFWQTFGKVWAIFWLTNLAVSRSEATFLRGPMAPFKSKTVRTPTVKDCLGN